MQAAVGDAVVVRHNTQSTDDALGTVTGRAACNAASAAAAGGALRA